MDKTADKYGSWRLIYIWKPKPNELYKEVDSSLLKIGQATLHAIKPISEYSKEELNQAALENRIRDYTNTSGMDVEMVETFVGITKDDEEVTDHQIHAFLASHGIMKEHLSGSTAQEWVRCSPEMAKLAIASYLDQTPQMFTTAVRAQQPAKTIKFRKEQQEAIAKTLKQWKKSTAEKPGEMLWNAKPRFGKTPTTYGFVKAAEAKSVLIITHRPQVIDGWARDIQRVLGDEYQYGAKNDVEGSIRYPWEKIDKDKPFVFFISMQDARGRNRSNAAADGTDENIDEEDVQIFKSSNKEIMGHEYDLVVVDEAHEGNETDLAIEVHESIKRRFTLNLSGTPFRLLENSNYTEEQIYTWDYNDEQEAKQAWYQNNPGEENPYASLPTMSMYTIDISQSIADAEIYGALDETGAFNFTKFFETDDSTSDFTEQAKKNITGMLDTLTSSVNTQANEQENAATGAYMPFHMSMVNENRHTLWRMPNVKSANAMEKLLNRHPVFSNYKIINVAGEDWKTKAKAQYPNSNYENPVNWVNEAISDKPYETKTITLTYSRLTVGVTVGAWSAVLWFSNTTSPESYIQTSFRAQSSCKNLHKDLDAGEISPKTRCRVYDFAPDRTLSVLAKSVGLSDRRGAAVETEYERREQLQKFMNFCPVLAYSGNTMKTYDVKAMMRVMRRMYSAEIVEKGFASEKLYNDNLLLNLKEEDLKDVEILKGLANATLNKTGENKLNINDQGFDEESYEQLFEKQKKAKADRPDDKKTMTEEEKELLKALNARREQARTVTQVLNAISIRIPMMILGTETYYDPEKMDIFDLDGFVNEFDDESWDEFMGKITKSIFLQNKRFFNEEILEASMREWLHRIDTVHKATSPQERYEAMKTLLGYLHNPDKETVITPAWVAEIIYETADISWVESEKTNRTFYEINSKSGIFPLIAAYKLHSQAPEGQEWERTIQKHVHANARTKAGQYITLRVLGISRNSWTAYNFTHLDVLKLKDSIEAWNKIKKDNRPVNWQKIDGESLYNFIGKILVIANKGMMKKLGIRLEGSIGFYRKLDEALDAIMDSDTTAELKIGELIDMVDKIENKGIEPESLKFDYTISNPPYQLEAAVNESNGSSTNSVNIFHIFQEAAMKNSKATAMIYPGGRWMQPVRGLKEFQKLLISSEHFKYLEWYPNGDDIPRDKKIFPTARIQDGVSIVVWDKGFKNDGKITFFDQQIKINQLEFIPTDPYKAKLISTLVNSMKCNKVDSLSHRVSARTLYGIESSFVEQNPKKVRADSEMPPADMISPIRLFTNDKSGTGGNPTWYWIEKEDIPNNQVEELTKWQVITSSAIKASQKKFVFDIIKPNEAHGRSRVSLAAFDTKVEAMNFKRYLEDPIIQDLLVASAPGMLTNLGVFVPDLKKYKETVNVTDILTGLLSIEEVNNWRHTLSY